MHDVPRIRGVDGGQSVMHENRNLYMVGVIAIWRSNLYFDPLLTVDSAHEDYVLQRNMPRVLLESRGSFIQHPKGERNVDATSHSIKTHRLLAVRKNQTHIYL